MKICMVAASLAGGGAERALLDTAAVLVSRGHEVTVVTFDDGTADAYGVPSDIARITLGVPSLSRSRFHGLLNNFRRITRLRKELSKLGPDVVISYLTRANIICLLSLLGTGRPVVATEHNVATLNDAPMQGLWNALRRGLYRRMAAVVVVSKGLAGQYTWLQNDKITVIYNFLHPQRGRAPESFDFLTSGTRYVVSMGRLEREKGFDKLIMAFHRVQQDCPGWKLLIVGEGTLRPDLTRLVRSLSLANRVEMPGRVENPRTLFGQCDLFVLSSESEGFGLVLVEAMSAGLPVISFDCDFGPREIITPGVSGVLVPAGDVELLSGAIKRLANDDGERSRLGRGGLDTVRCFAEHEILHRWEALLRRVTRANTAGRDPDRQAQTHEVQ